jgi:predicted PolB exonuclease-like 3'-5' exonuclease
MDAVDQALRNVLFVDIETASAASDYHELDIRMQRLWDKKSLIYSSEGNFSTPDLYFNKASLHAEFGKIIVISAAYFYLDDNQELCLRVKAFHAPDEKQLLEDFVELLGQKHFNSRTLRLCAHNGKDFDFPYLSRRMLVNNIKVPEVLDVLGKKPWEVSHLDTMDIWRFGDRRETVSLETLAAIFGLPDYTSDMNNSKVNEVYYRENNLEKIAAFSKKDVSITARVYLKLNNLPMVDEQHIFYV